jgi:hypothetical protein
MTESDRRQGTYSEGQLREIVARASLTQLPADLSESQVREICRELGIEPGAVEAAMADIRVGDLAHIPDRARLGLGRYGGYGAALVLIGAAGLPGVLSGGLEGIMLGAYAVMLVSSGSSARRGGHSALDAVISFQRRNFVSWGSFVIAATTVTRIANPTWLGNESTGTGLTIAALWALSSVVGGLTAWRAGPRNGPTVHANSRPPWRERLAARIRAMVDAVLLPFELIPRGHSALTRH